VPGLGLWPPQAVKVKARNKRTESGFLFIGSPLFVQKLFGSEALSELIGQLLAAIQAADIIILVGSLRTGSWLSDPGVPTAEGQSQKF
jgi:hypothetical protein